MIEVYSKNELELIAKNQKNTMTLAIALPSIAFVLAVVFCFLADTDTLSIFKAIGSTISVLSAWICVFCVFNRLPKLRNNASHINIMLSGQRICVSCRVLKIDEPKTIAENRLAYEVYVDDGNSAFYFEAKSGGIPFSNGDFIDIVTVNNYIVAYEVKK